MWGFVYTHNIFVIQSAIEKANTMGTLISNIDEVAINGKNNQL